MIETLREKAKDAARSESGRDAEGSEGRREFYGWYSTNITKLTGTDGLDISEYNRLVYVLIDDGVRSQSYDKPVDPAKLVVTVSDNRYDSTAEAFTRMPTADLSDFVSRFIALSSQKDAGIITDDEFNAGCKSICMIDINENVRLYITDANISHNIDDKPIDINIEGYLLMK